MPARIKTYYKSKKCNDYSSTSQNSLLFPITAASTVVDSLLAKNVEKRRSSTKEPTKMKTRSDTKTESTPRLIDDSFDLKINTTFENLLEGPHYQSVKYCNISSLCDNSSTDNSKKYTEVPEEKPPPSNTRKVKTYSKKRNKFSVSGGKISKKKNTSKYAKNYSKKLRAHIDKSTIINQVSPETPPKISPNSSSLIVARKFTPIASTSKVFSQNFTKNNSLLFQPGVRHCMQAQTSPKYMLSSTPLFSKTIQQSNIQNDLTISPITAKKRLNYHSRWKSLFESENSLPSTSPIKNSTNNIIIIHSSMSDNDSIAPSFISKFTSNIKNDFNINYSKNLSLFNIKNKSLIANDIKFKSIPIVILEKDFNIINLRNKTKRKVSENTNSNNNYSPRVNLTRNSFSKYSNKRKNLMNIPEKLLKIDLTQNSFSEYFNSKTKKSIKFNNSSNISSEDTKIRKSVRNINKKSKSTMKMSLRSKKQSSETKKPVSLRRSKRKITKKIDKLSINYIVNLPGSSRKKIKPPEDQIPNKNDSINLQEDNTQKTDIRRLRSKSINDSCDTSSLIDLNKLLKPNNKMSLRTRLNSISHDKETNISNASLLTDHNYSKSLNNLNSSDNDLNKSKKNIIDVPKIDNKNMILRPRSKSLSYNNSKDKTLNLSKSSTILFDDESIPNGPENNLVINNGMSTRSKQNNELKTEIKKPKRVINKMSLKPSKSNKNDSIFESPSLNDGILKSLRSRSQSLCADNDKKSIIDIDTSNEIDTSVNIIENSINENEFQNKFVTTRRGKVKPETITAKPKLLAPLLEWERFSNDNFKLIKITEETSENSEKCISPRSEISNVTDKILTNGHKINDFNNSINDTSVFLKPGKQWMRSLSILRRTNINDINLNETNNKGRKWRDSIYEIHGKQDKIKGVLNVSGHQHNEIFKNTNILPIPRIKSLTRRTTLQIVPLSLPKNTSISTNVNSFIEEIDSTSNKSGYVSTLADESQSVLESFDKLSLTANVEEREETARQIILKRCGQTTPILFDDCYSQRILEKCRKIGEGVYGEVFMYKTLNNECRVMKVIPIEGNLVVNGEHQKKFEEIISEIIIASELSNLRRNKEFCTNGFNELLKISCVQGKYPQHLLDLWNLYDEDHGSENDSPEIFTNDQLYIVLELANGGQDLEAYRFNNAEQSFAVFVQVVCSLAVAESALQFEHRDMHWGNILISPTNDTTTTFRLKGRDLEVATKGVQVSIIDFTLSRMTYNQCCIFNDLALDPDLFTATGDYQFDIYRLMRQRNQDDWQRFEPYSNILWLDYTLEKMITQLRYLRVNTKTHKTYIRRLSQMRKKIFNYNSATEFLNSEVFSQVFLY